MGASTLGAVALHRAHWFDNNSPQIALSNQEFGFFDPVLTHIPSYSYLDRAAEWALAPPNPGQPYPNAAAARLRRCKKLCPRATVVAVRPLSFRTGAALVSPGGFWLSGRPCRTNPKKIPE